MEDNNSSLGSFMTTNRNNILEPLTSLIRLCMIFYENDGVKIGINYNRISIYRNYFFQGSLRKFYSESREDLHNLHNPILKAKEWYNIDCKEINYIFEFAIKGLKKLKESYQSQSIISHSLSSYSDILQKELNTFNDQFNNDEKFLKEIDLSLDDSQKGSLYKSLINIWDYRSIQTIYNLLKDLEENKIESNKWVHLKTLDNLISSRENQVYQIIIDNSTIL